jgi:FtsH-binding integral membrane protein
MESKHKTKAQETIQPKGSLLQSLIPWWIGLSITICLGGLLWKYIQPADPIAPLVYFFGLISSLLAVGYYSTPTGSLFGKVAYSFVVVTVVGIVMKVLHVVYANEMIAAGLAGIAITFIIMWVRKAPYR